VIFIHYLFEIMAALISNFKTNNHQCCGIAARANLSQPFSAAALIFN